MNGNVGDGSCICSMVDHGSVESHRYFLARRTVLEMLRDRGYDVSDSDINLSLEDFRSIHGSENLDLERLRISASLLSDPSEKVLVIFCGADKVKVAIIRGICTQIMNKDILSQPSRVILILQNEITAPARKALDLLKLKVEIFQITDLLMNITKHVLKPKHEILTPEEKRKLLKKFSLEDKQTNYEIEGYYYRKGDFSHELKFKGVNVVKIPRMLENDAIARYYGLKKGQVVKVTYGGEITGSHVTYRCVM